MDKNCIYLGSTSKKKPRFFRKFSPMLPMSRIGPGLIFFRFLILFIYVINIGQKQALFIR